MELTGLQITAIRKVERADNKVTVRMKDGDVVLTVMEK